MWDTLYVYVCTYLVVLVLLGLTYTLYIGGRVYVQGTRNNLYDGWGWGPWKGTYLRWHVPLKCPDCIGDILILKLPELVIKYLDWNN